MCSVRCEVSMQSPLSHLVHSGIAQLDLGARRKCFRGLDLSAGWSRRFRQTGKPAALKCEKLWTQGQPTRHLREKYRKITTCNSLPLSLPVLSHTGSFEPLRELDLNIIECTDAMLDIFGMKLPKNVLALVFCSGILSNNKWDRLQQPRTHKGLHLV